MFLGRMASWKAKVVSIGLIIMIGHMYMPHLAHAKHFTNIIIFNIYSSPAR